MTIEAHMSNFLSAMTKEGYPEKSVQMYRNPIFCFIRFCQDNARQEVDVVMVEQFIDYQTRRCETGEISSGTLDYYRRPVRNFLNYIDTGMVHPVRRQTPKHESLFESVIDDIRTDDAFNTPDRAHMVSTANIFFSWLEENKCLLPSDITVEHIRKVMSYTRNFSTYQVLVQVLYCVCSQIL
jgi:site-specific recombinase XerD